ncbi:MAG TPA: hypothetical protein VFQ20_07465 [Burkholderiaceae bacterium]|nr:hypothetical protein [Burkholderiaceae bacterium]
MRLEPAIATLPIDAPRWSTSSFDPDAPDSTQELTSLGEHLDHCKGSHGRLFTLQCVAETLDRFLSARLVTTLVVAALLMGVASILA